MLDKVALQVFDRQKAYVRDKNEGYHGISHRKKIICLRLLTSNKLQDSGGASGDLYGDSSPQKRRKHDKVTTTES
jgi:hypothetical protein